MRLVTISLLAACDSAVLSPSPGPPVTADLDARAQLIRTVADAAREFRAWPRVDDALRAALIPCDGVGMAPAQHLPPALSAATDGEHKRKLFYLRTNNQRAYLSEDPVPVGFAIVKEAFAAVPARESPHCDPNQRRGQYCMQRDDVVVSEGARLRAGPAAGLFVMAKVATLVGTDDHWIYGTVSTAGRVISAGRIASCMGCHEDASHERLFGMN